MANPEHLAKLNEGVEAWNEWRGLNPEIRPDLAEANLRGMDLHKISFGGVNLRGADLSEANLLRADINETQLHGARLSGANLFQADLRGACLDGADLSGADFRQANLREADLSRAYLIGTDLRGAHLRGAHLRGAHLRGANLSEADLSEADLLQAGLNEAVLRLATLNKADLRGAYLCGADLRGTRLRGADLSGANVSRTNLNGADLREATLVETNLEGANLTDCSAYGISAWNVKLAGAIQSNLVITPPHQPPIQVDNLEVAQFIFLLLNSEKIRTVIDTITSKVVLILGRFTPERKVVLDAIRDGLRKRDYLPVLFDFEKPASKDLTGTISTLANMARFVIADLTDPSSVPHELATLVPNTVVPVQTIIMEGQLEYAMFPDLKARYHWVLEPYSTSHRSC